MSAMLSDVEKDGPDDHIYGHLYNKWKKGDRVISVEINSKRRESFISEKNDFIYILRKRFGERSKTILENKYAKKLKDSESCIEISSVNLNNNCDENCYNSSQENLQLSLPSLNAERLKNTESLIEIGSVNLKNNCDENCYNNSQENLLSSLSSPNDKSFELTPTCIGKNSDLENNFNGNIQDVNSQNSLLPTEEQREDVEMEENDNLIKSTSSRLSVFERLSFRQKVFFGICFLLAVLLIMYEATNDSFESSNKTKYKDRPLRTSNYISVSLRNISEDINSTRKIDRYKPIQKTFNVCKLHPEVTRLISEEIGNKWDSLARHLDVKEGQIDYIDYKYQQTSEKMNACLQIFESVPRINPLDILLKALVSARRTDLVNKVTERARIVGDCYMSSNEE